MYGSEKKIYEIRCRSPYSSMSHGATNMQFVSTVSLVTCMCVAPLSRESKATCPVAGADNPLVVEIWPGKVPDETYTIGAEKCRMSPELSREQVEVTEPPTRKS